MRRFSTCTTRSPSRSVSFAAYSCGTSGDHSCGAGTRISSCDALAPARAPRAARSACACAARRARAARPQASARRRPGRCARARRPAAGRRGSPSRARGSSRPRACRGPRCAPARPGTSRTGRTMPFQFHQASGSFGFLRPSTITSSSLRRARPQAARLEAERACRDRCCARAAGRSGRRSRARRTLSNSRSQRKPRGGLGTGEGDAGSGAPGPRRGRAARACRRRSARAPGATRRPPGRRVPGGWPGSPAARPSGSGLLGRRRLRRGRVGGLDAHLPAAREAALARRRVGRRGGGRGERAGAGMTGAAGAASAPHRSQM